MDYLTRLLLGLAAAGLVILVELFANKLKSKINMENSNNPGPNAPETKSEILPVVYHLYLWMEGKNPPPFGVIPFQSLDLADLFLHQMFDGTFAKDSEAILNEVWLKDGQPVKETIVRQLYLADSEHEHKLIECNELVYDNTSDDPGLHLVQPKPEPVVTITVPLNRKNRFRKI